jgi:hypothetical protein
MVYTFAAGAPPADCRRVAGALPARQLFGRFRRKKVQSCCAYIKAGIANNSLKIR